MVKIAVAGGGGHLASELIDIIAASKKHSILIISRSDPKSPEKREGVTWAKVDYTNQDSLVTALRGIHTVLCFTAAHNDPESLSQKALIQASIAAGVKRYAPNEWSGSSEVELPWYAEKTNIKTYLADINKDKKVIEYTLFQPGFIADYLRPTGTNAHLVTPELWLDFNLRRAILLEDKDPLVTLTTLADLAAAVQGAIEYEGEWPVVGTIQGTNLTNSKLLEIGEKVTGKKWDVTYVKYDDVKANTFEPPWVPRFKDDSLTDEVITAFSKVILRGSLLSGVEGSWLVGDEWNRLLGIKTQDAEAFLEAAWKGKA